MMYVLYGNNTAESRKKLASLVETLISRKPDAMLLRYNEDSADEQIFTQHLQSQGLFEEKSIIVLDGLLQSASQKSLVTDNLKALQESQNVFIILEEKLDKKMVTKLEKYSEKIQEFTKIKDTKAAGNFNIFELSDALGNKNKKRLWTLYQVGKMENISDEEMHGILFWGVKNMILAKSSTSAKEANLSPFVYKKAQSFSQNFTHEELRNLSQNLMELYHQARRGQRSFDTAFEKLLLKVV